MISGQSSNPAQYGSTKRRLFNLGLLSLLTWVGFALRLYHLGQPSLWYDELLQLDIAQGPFRQIDSHLLQHAAMPFDYYLLHFWISGGRQEMWVRFPALLWGTLAIPLIYALARRMVNRRVGYLAALLLACSLFAIRYSQEVRPYALLLMWTLVAFLGLWQLYRTQQRRYWGLAAVGLMGAAFSHYFSLFLLLPVGLFVLFALVRPVGPHRAWPQALYFGLALLLVAATFASGEKLDRLRSVSLRFVTTVTSQPESLAHPPAEKPNRGFGPPLELNFLVEQVVMPLATTNRSILGFYSLLFLASWAGLVDPSARRRQATWLLLGWLLLPIALIYLFLLHRGTFYAQRYILYTLPAYLILVAAGLDRLLAALVILRQRLSPTSVSILSPARLRIGLCLLALLPLILTWQAELLFYYRLDSREDWRAVGQLLAAHATPTDAVIAVRAEPAINWYYPPAQATPGTFTTDQAVRQALAQHRRRWIVLSSYSADDDRGLRRWLSQRQAVRIALDRRVELFFHVEGLSRAALLAQVKDFALPQKARTYQILAEQFRQSGDMATAQAFQRHAARLAAPAAPK